KLSHRDASVAFDYQDRQAAVCGHVLILFADAFLQNIELNVTGLFGQGLQRDIAAAVVVQRVQQSHEIAARRSEAGAGRTVSDGRDFKRVLDSMRLERLARQLVFELAD